ncbi:MAG: hypothetical protein ACI4HL_01105 [Ruminococcus sp.]
MKRIIPIIIALMLLACLAGCDSSSDNNAETTNNGTVVVTQSSSTSGVENTSTASSNSAAYIYDGTGDAKGAIITTVKWNDSDKIQIINDMIHSNSVISNNKKDKEDTSKADKVYCFELINKGTSNNIFYVYLIDDKVYLYGDEFASSLNTFINGYADETTVEQVESLLK